MTAAVGLPTLRLIRWSVGPWTLAGLAPGEWRAESSRAHVLMIAPAASHACYHPPPPHALPLADAASAALAS